MAFSFSLLESGIDNLKKKRLSFFLKSGNSRSVLHAGSGSIAGLPIDFGPFFASISFANVWTESAHAALSLLPGACRPTRLCPEPLWGPTFAQGSQGHAAATSGLQ
jgi:hypothetical protein